MVYSSVANFKPFRALRYSADDDLRLVTAPPYDVISDEAREALRGRDPHNIVHITLGADHDSLNQYKSAGRLLREWVETGVLELDSKESYFLYRMDFSSHSQPQAWAGMVGALELSPFGEQVLPHEQTMPGPKADRLALMRATSANLEPLWFVSRHRTGLVAEAVHSESVRTPIADLVDDDGIRHRLWKSTGEGEDFATALKDGQVVIADGHHRYETALTYSLERRATDSEGPWDLTLAVIQEPGEFGPILQSIHRLTDEFDTGMLSDLPVSDFRGSLEDLFHRIESGGPGTMGLVNKGEMFTIACAYSPDTLFLTRDIIEPLNLRPSFEHDLDIVKKEISGGKAAFIMAPLSVQTVLDYAGRGERMPPKTTLFWPKPRSGLLIRTL